MYSSLCVRLPDVWVNESDRLQQKTKVVHLSKLPTDTAVLLDPNIYRSVCLSVCLSQLVRWYTTNKKKNSWIKYLNPFFPTGCSSNRLQRNSTVLSLPANQTSRRIASFSLCLQLYIPLLPLPEDAGRLVTYCQGCLRPPLFSLLGAEFTEGHVGKMLLVLGNITRLKANWQKCNCRHV